MSPPPSASTAIQWRRFFAPFFAKPRLFWKMATGPIIWALIAAIDMGLVKQIIQSVEGGEKTTAIYLLCWFVGLHVVGYVTMLVFRNRGYVIGWPYMEQYLEDIYFPKFIRLDNNTVEGMGVGRVMETVIKGKMSWVNALNEFTHLHISSVVFVCASFVILWHVGWVYLVVGCVALVVLSMFVIRMQRALNRGRRMRKVMIIERARQRAKIIMAKNEILQNDRIDAELDILHDITYRHYAINTQFTGWAASEQIGMSIVPDIAQIVVIGGLGLGLWFMTQSVADFVVVFSLLAIYKEIIKKTRSAYVQLMKEMVHIEKMRDFFDETPEITGLDHATPFVYQGGDISFEDVTYAYEGENYILRDFSCAIKGQQTTALVGASGGGKSTIVKLLTGYLHPTAGRIRIGDHYLDDVNLTSYYAQIGYLSQEPSIFDGSIYDNLIYAVATPPSDDEMRRVLQDAKCEFVYDLPDGLDTQIGERGIKLSGGQKQRLAIAKIMLKSPSIIFLDEPSSALDSYAESDVMEALATLFAGRTVVIIAHRLQTVMDADDIIVIDQGKVVERGTHDELLAHDGQYRGLVDLQTGGVV